MALRATTEGQKLVCQNHNLIFTDHKEFHLHKLQSRDHITCPVCSVDFRTQEGYKVHHDQTHPAEQNLVCPGGCSKIFARVGALIHDIEMNECSATHSYQNRREKVNNEVGQFERIRQAAAAMEPGAELYGLLPPTWTPPPVLTPPPAGRDNPTHKAQKTPLYGDASPCPLPDSPLIYFTPDVPNRRSDTITTCHRKSEMSIAQELDDDGDLMASHVLNTPWGENISTDTPITTHSSAEVPPSPSLIKLTTFVEASYGSNFPALGFGPNSLANTLKGLPNGSTTAGRSDRSGLTPTTGNHTQSFLDSSVTDSATAKADLISSATYIKSTSDFSAKRVQPAWSSNAPQTVAPKSSVFPQAWTVPKKVFPEAPSTTQPPSGPLESITTYSKVNQNQSSNELSTHDPSNPSFKSGRYFFTVLNKYKCPHMGCNKSFERESLFIQHLKSPAHLAETSQLKCPRCLRHFNSATALTQHAESQGSRCDIRHHGEFGAYVNDITANTAAVDGLHDDNTVKYVVQDFSSPTSVQARSNSERVAAANANFIQRDNEAIETYWDARRPKW